MMIMLNTQECVLTDKGMGKGSDYNQGGGRSSRGGSRGGGRVNYLRCAIVDAVEPTMREHQQMNFAKRWEG